MKSDTAMFKSSIFSRLSNPSLVVPVFAFLGYFALAHYWAASPYVLHQWDTFFDADANKYFEWFIQGRPDLGRVEALHPLLAQMIGWPIRLATLPLGWWSTAVMLTTRNEFALAICPFAAAFTLALQVKALALLGCSLLRQWLMALLSSLSLAMLVFGSLPEQFALSGLAVSGVLYMMAREIAGVHIPRSWIFVGGLAAVGVVMSNLVMFALLVLFLGIRRRSRLHSRYQTIVFRTAAYTGLVCATVLILAGLTTWAERVMADKEDRPIMKSGLNSLFLFKKSLVDVASQVILMPIQAMSPSQLQVVKIRDLPFPDQRSPAVLDNPAIISGSRLSPASILMTILFGAAISVGVRSWLTLSPLALVLLVALWLMYVPILWVYSGSDPFLFSLHVLPPILFLMALAPRERIWRIAQRASLLGLLASCVVQNFDNIQTMLMTVADNPLRSAQHRSGI